MVGRLFAWLIDVLGCFSGVGLLSGRLCACLVVACECVRVYVLVGCVTACLLEWRERSCCGVFGCRCVGWPIVD